MHRNRISGPADGAAGRAFQIRPALFDREERDEEQAEVEILPEPAGSGQPAGGAGQGPFIQLYFFGLNPADEYELTPLGFVAGFNSWKCPARSE